MAQTRNSQSVGGAHQSAICTGERKPTLWGGGESNGSNLSGYFNWLGIGWIHEQPVFVADSEGRPRLWMPDFYLAQLGVYIEVIGRPGVDYPYRRKVYAANKIPVLFVQVADDHQWMRNLVKDIRSIHEARNSLLRRVQAPRPGQVKW